MVTWSVCHDIRKPWENSRNSTLSKFRGPCCLFPGGKSLLMTVDSCYLPFRNDIWHLTGFSGWYSWRNNERFFNFDLCLRNLTRMRKVEQPFMTSNMLIILPYLHLVKRFLTFLIEVKENFSSVWFSKNLKSRVWETYQNHGEFVHFW